MHNIDQEPLTGIITSQKGGQGNVSNSTSHYSSCDTSFSGNFHAFLSGGIATLSTIANTTKCSRMGHLLFWEILVLCSYYNQRNMASNSII
jgi:hypothetical protein